MIRFTVIGLPAAQGSKRALPAGGQPGARTILIESSRSVASWRRLVADAAQDYAPEQPITGAVRLHLSFRLPVPKSAPRRRRLWATKRPDLDKLTRAIKDALTHVMWRDDAQIVRMIVAKDLAYDAPVGVDIRIEDLEGQDAITAYAFNGSDNVISLELLP